MPVVFTALMVFLYQSIPILIKPTPQPVGFGGDALSIANLQLPRYKKSLSNESSRLIDSALPQYEKTICIQLQG
jgi:hypothetical protein